ncbi:MAG: radical SAM protein [Actinomycetota bacterium]|nr:radical SAM protein [Actinomycetota bacterium]
MLLVSTYELGHQPLGLAVPAGALLAAGHEVRCADLSIESLDSGDVAWANALAVSVPMHTATRLARQVIGDVRAMRPDLPVALYGLYATVGGATVDLAVAGEYVPELVAWADRLGRSGATTAAVSRGTAAGLPPAAHLQMTADTGADAAVAASAPGGTAVAAGAPTGAVIVRLGRHRQSAPARHLLPPLERYAHVLVGGERRVAGYVEASHGCAHRCRHCPVPVVYDGRTRLVDVPGLLADVDELVQMGARHITFGDPDFLNGPHHARRTVQAVHGAFPDLTFDATVKVEHVLRHRSAWPDMAEAGFLFVTTAVESADNRVLARLHKGHTVADAVEAIRVLRSAGIEPRPTFVPFTPWTDASGVVALLDLIARCDLAGNVDPVQLGIRLLLPPGSLLLDDPDLRACLDGYDDHTLGWRWHSADERLDTLAGELAALAEEAESAAWPAATAHLAARRLVADRLRLPSSLATPAADPAVASRLAPEARPRLSEAWFCCAEPTGRQWAAAGTTGSCG